MNQMPQSLIESMVASPCSNPEMGLEEVLAAYSEIGFRNFEVFTSWAGSAFDVERGTDEYLRLGRKYGLRFTSFHLPPVTDDLDGSLDRSARAAAFAAELGVEVVLFKATSRQNYIQAAGRYLNATEALGLTPVLQNHAGTAISSLEDFREAIGGIDDPRMRTLLEVGHLHTVGVSWQEGYQLLGDSIALVHIKDQIGKQSVPFGTGEIDLPGLFRHLRSVGYTGRYVVEMEVEDKENTLRYLREALDYLDKYCSE